MNTTVITISFRKPHSFSVYSPSFKKAPLITMNWGRIAEGPHWNTNKPHRSDGPAFSEYTENKVRHTYFTDGKRVQPLVGLLTSDLTFRFPRLDYDCILKKR